MRQAGTIADEGQARLFAEYLFARGITARIDREEGGFGVWIREEEQVGSAMEELREFLARPDDPKYQETEAAARNRRSAEAKQTERMRRNYYDMRRRWDGPSGSRPLTAVLLGMCIVVAVFTGLGEAGADPDEPPNELVTRLSFTDLPRDEQGEREWDEGKQARGLAAIRRGEVWRLFTPALLHFGALHLIFNMMWLWELGGLIEVRRGSLLLGMLVLLCAVGGNVAQYWMGDSPWFGGMSGVVYGLFGYVWMKSRFDPAAEMYIHPNTVALMVVWFLVCAAGWAGPIANWAHGVGLALGMIVGYSPVAWRRLRRGLA